jgi:signal transduction histidine kinase
MLSSNRMSTAVKHNYADWMFGALMFLLCAGLTVLQYHWTGEIANAELVRLRADLDEQSRAMARAFDAELSESCEQLLPPRGDSANQAGESGFVSRFKAWKASNPRPIFSRIALASPTGDHLQLSMLDIKSDQFTRTNWPDQWADLEENLTEKLTGNSPPFNDWRGALIEFPLFDGGFPRGGPLDPNKVHWLILELDLDYARATWLPELAARYIDPDHRGFNEVRVETAGFDPSVLYTSQTNGSVPGASAVTVRFNQQGRPGDRFHGPPQSGRWLLETWYRPGALEATVSASRARNLAVAVMLNLLMLTTGVALMRNTRRSRQLAEAQMDFVANVSHELRTPLTVIRGAAHNLKRGVVHERSQVEQYSGLIMQHAEQLTEMIEQLLQLAGAKKNQGNLSHNPVGLGQILKDAAAAAEHDTRAASCVVELAVPDTLPPVSGDAASLRRVFQNLITNAAKHGGDGKWIGITAAVVNGENAPTIEVRVEDRGAGIAESEQAEIFKPFARGAAAKARQVRGSGLGLSLVREIVEHHHGSVTVNSKPGRGAAFIVSLPATADSIK